ncbi:MAG: type I polyketide synthase [Firmicutes bacterium]|nr:type I polyketide synthase [Bacillota bacterium]
MTIKSSTTIKEPIAIIGMGCRFPGGASSPSRLWEILCDGVDAITDVPPDRWDMRRFYHPDPDRPGKAYAKQAGFLREDVYRFDPLFFGISPREAASMDPQQRLLLEVTWEAIEDAGLQVERLGGSSTGVFIGGFCMDESTQLVLNQNTANNYSGVGTALTILSARISYVFDLRGPCVAMDTACSSSLVAVHYACQGIWNGECGMAIAGGVNVMTNPRDFILMSKGMFLSPHSRCRTFDEDAAGYARGEGVGVVILKPLSKALEDKDPIYAVVRGTGINHDGQTSGITIPNPAAQEALIREVQAQAGVLPGEVHYIEAHGTGTQAGDQAEAMALHRVLREGRETGDRCVVGSLKTNIGHLEAAAGVAGLIKAALCLKRRMIPGNLHFKRPNPLIPFGELSIRVAAGLEEWPDNGNPAYAGVNSFGFGGTNAHVVLEGPPVTVKKNDGTGVADREGRPLLIPVSARDAGALKQLAQRYGRFLEGNVPEAGLEDFAYSTVVRRSHHDYRLALAVDSREGLIENLKLFGEGETPSLAASNRVLPAENRRVVFVYSGMGPQWWAMGRELLQREPVFLQVLEECDEVFKGFSGWSLLEELRADESSSRMGDTQVAQPAGVALQVGLTALWRSWGIRPAAVVGHSVGEIAAAYAAGVLSLREAMLVSYHRSRLQRRLAGKGKMLAAALTEERAREATAGLEDVSIAAVNSSLDVTLAGIESSLREIAAGLESEEVFNRFLQVDIAYHSPQMEEIREELVSNLGEIEGDSGEMPFYSTVVGERIDGTEVTPGYWWRNVRQPVLFGAAIDSLLRDGYRVFLEVGPHPVLGGYVRQSLRDAGTSGQVLASLSRGKPEQLQMIDTLGSFYTLGFDIDWREIAPAGEYIPLPGYPWQHERFRSDSRLALEDKLGCRGHVFLNQDLRLPRPAWEVELSDQLFPYLKDHQLQKSVVFPGAGYVEAGLALNAAVYERKECRLESLVFHQMMFYSDKSIQKIQFHLDQKTREYSVYSRPEGDDGPWMLHASGLVMTPILDGEQERVDLEGLRSRCPLEVPVEEMYVRLGRNDWNYGPSFKALRRVWRGEGEVLAEIQGMDALLNDSDGYLLHPVVLDAAFQSLLAGFGDEEDDRARMMVPVSIGRVSFYSPPGSRCFSRGRVTRAAGDSIDCDIVLFDEDGGVLVKIDGLRCQEVNRDGEEDEEQARMLYRVNWCEAAVAEPTGTDAGAGGWIVFGAESEGAKALVGYIAARVERCVIVSRGEAFAGTGSGGYRIRRGVGEDLDAVFSTEKERGFDTVLYLGGVGDPVAGPARAEEAVAHCVYVTELANALARLGRDHRSTLGIVTTGAQSIGKGEPLWNLEASPLWGLGMLIPNEYPMIRCKLVDIDSPFSEEETAAVFDEFRLGRSEEDVAFRPGRRLVKKLWRMKGGPEETPVKRRNTASTPVMLDVARPGDLDSLAYKEIARREPGPGEIEVEVHYSALNYKDFLKAMGLVPEMVLEGTFVGRSLGLESSGRVAAVGEGVEEFQAGDEVVVGGVGFRSFVTVPAILAGHKPGALSLAEAPVFVGFITAYYGLVEIARLQPGERVLIHNATGGVGMAALQVAQWVGAEIFATAGSEEKRALLREMGIEQVMNSRSSRFVDQVRSATRGEGVDVVLNAMAGEALVESLSLLAPYGRFIEIGKRDIVENSGLPMREFNRNLTFASVDLDRMAMERPRVFSRLLREVGRLFVEGRFKAMPVQVFPAGKAPEAFRLMGQSRHIGKVVLDMRDQEVPMLQGAQGSPQFKKDAVYLVTGGTSGLGLEAAKWMASRGAGHLVLVSRTGATEPSDRAIEAIRRHGASATVMSVDVTDERRVERMMEEINRSLPPLRGIIHGAMVLDDGFLTDMTEERFARVMGPKVKGALNLHRHTLGMELDFFLSLSSIQSLVGSAGQANYVAANAFLDAFAHHRRGIGLPATVVNLGVLSEIGVAARSSWLEELFKTLGVRGLKPRATLEMIGEILGRDLTQAGLFDVDWKQWADVNPESAVSSRIRELVEESASEPQDDQRSMLIGRLSSMDPGQRQEYMEETLRTILAGVLRTPYSKVLPDQNILLLGMDSIMALELRHLVKSELGLEITTLELLKGPSIRKMAALFLERLELPAAETAERASPNPAPAEDGKEGGYHHLLG